MRKKSLLVMLSVTFSLFFFGFVSQSQSVEKKSATEQQAAKAGLNTPAVKAHITKKEKSLATGIGSAHQSVSVTFESIRFGKARKTTPKDRVVNGIEGPMVYPVRVKYTSHRRWGNGETETKNIHYDYEFYKDSYGEWNTYMVGPVNN